MSKTTGVMLILSGVAVAAYALSEGDTGDPMISVAQTDAVKSGVGDAQPGAPGQLMVAPEPRPAFRPIPSMRTPDAAPAVSAPVVVTVAQRPAEAPPVAPRASIPRDRDTLVRELQKELRRVGCYDGELHGVWTPATRRAMKAFMDRANATLPLDEPDPVLYAMVQGQSEQLCGKACPSGQGMSEEGRCVPTAILAKASRKTNPWSTQVAAQRSPAEHKPAAVITGWSTTSTPAAPSTGTAAPALSLVAAPPAEGRMALAGPVSEDTPPNPAAAAAPPTPPPAFRPTPPKPAKAKSSWAMQILARRDSQN